MHIGIDLMGSGHAPALLLASLLRIAEEIDSDSTLLSSKKPRFLLLATPEVILAHPSLPPSLEWISVEEFIEMDEAPLMAVRRKKRSSLAIGMQLLHAKQLDAFISLGNTGALVASATLHLPLLPGIEKPALLALLPTAKDSVFVLDVGAHVHPSINDLLQFAQLGAWHVRALGRTLPVRMGLLNIGIEKEKGTKQIQAVYEIFQEKFQDSSEVQFLGNIEGREIFQGGIDLLVTDGFSGNIFLKTAEGVSAFILDSFKSLVDAQILHKLSSQLDYSKHPGAFLIGFEGLVIKCHGSAGASALQQSIKVAMHSIEVKLIEQMKQLAVAS